MPPQRLILILAIVAVLIGAAVLWQKRRGPAPAQIATTALPAPAWKLKDLDGHEIRSDQFKGKVVVLDFWATWCGPCVEEIPGYVAMQKKYGPRGLVIVGVSMDSKGPAHVKQFALTNGMNYTLVMGDEDVVEAFGNFQAIPTTFLISREGRILNQKTGAAPPEEYEKLVKWALD